MLLATKTLAAIEAALQKDQGAAFRGHLRDLMPLAGDAYRTDEDDWRDHLGASLIGRECERELWYSFRWTTLKRFDGRMIRLFNRGHLEEPRFLAMLKMIGCTVWQLDHNGKQFRISGHRGHFGGSQDGVAQGVPDIPDQPILTEFKTHNDKSFQKLRESGVMAAKWEHFVQMQIYMGKNGLRWALYCAVNKNDDDIHMELVQFDSVMYAKYLERVVKIIDNREPPKRISTSPGFFKCKWCDQNKVCHGLAEPARNCRTCIHSEVRDDGKWFCNCKERQLELLFPAQNPLGEDYFLTPARQRMGCDKYEVNPFFKG